MTRRLLLAASLAGYVASVVLANWLTSHYGLVPVLPGLVTRAGTYAAGAALGLRDLVQQIGGRRLAVLAIAAAAVLSWVLSSPQLAIASATAFLLAELADFAVYTPLRERGWVRAVLASNIVGAPIDTLVFLGLAGFPLTWSTVLGQLVGKLLWATLVPVLILAAVSRAVPRQPVLGQGA